ncbi:MAG: indole-3-glycerol phosphate synthase TrpC, partial [Flavobacteriaceae bacterium]|nr:indole-3-glycerol phosphate synthase TrpC [Flavobacteriaceae bacterium]
KEVAFRKTQLPISQLEETPFFARECLSLSKQLLESPSGIIAEFKRKSPSESEINRSVEIEDVARGYEAAGASGMSVLTDSLFFGGDLTDLVAARQSASLPLLRKDFMIDEYQLYEAKAHGADVILLIAAVLSAQKIVDLTSLARHLGMEVLLEVHNETELKNSFTAGIQMLGVNNRNLKTFNVDIQTSIELAALAPEGVTLVSESGLKSPQDVITIRKAGYRGFLIGTHFMRHPDPGHTAGEFIKQLAV